MTRWTDIVRKIGHTWLICLLDGATHLDVDQIAGSHLAVQIGHVSFCWQKSAAVEFSKCTNDE